MGRVVKHWHRLPGDVTVSPSLEIIKTWLDMALSNLQQRSLPWAGVGLDAPQRCLLASITLCLLHNGVGIPHLDCYMLIQNKYQCLRTQRHFTAFYFSVGTATNVMPMARDVINYPLLQQMLWGVRHMKQKTYTEDQTKTSDSNIYSRSRRVFSVFGSCSALKYNYCSLSNKRRGLSIKLFFFLFFLFNSYQPDFVASFSHSFPP